MNKKNKVFTLFMTGFSCSKIAQKLKIKEEEVQKLLIKKMIFKKLNLK